MGARRDQDLTDRWAELRYDAPDLTPAWLRPVVGTVGAVFGVLAGDLLVLLVPIALVAGAVVAGVQGLWLLSALVVRWSRSWCS